MRRTTSASIFLLVSNACVHTYVRVERCSVDSFAMLRAGSHACWKQGSPAVVLSPAPLPDAQALDEIMAFSLQQQAAGEAVTQEDIDDVRDAGRALAASLDDFLALAPPEDLRMVQNLLEPSR